MAVSTARDLKLDVLTGDLAVEGGDLVILSGSDALLQAIKIRMQFFKGECYLAQEAGIPYYQEILGVKNPNPNLLQSIFRKVLLETPGVLEVNALSLTLDGAARSLAVAFRVDSDFGELAATVVI